MGAEMCVRGRGAIVRDVGPWVMAELWGASATVLQTVTRRRQGARRAEGVREGMQEELRAAIAAKEEELERRGSRDP